MCVFFFFNLFPIDCNYMQKFINKDVLKLNRRAIDFLRIAEYVCKGGCLATCYSHYFYLLLRDLTRIAGA